MTSKLAWIPPPPCPVSSSFWVPPPRTEVICTWPLTTLRYHYHYSFKCVLGTDICYITTISWKMHDRNLTGAKNKYNCNECSYNCNIKRRLTNCPKSFHESIFEPPFRVDKIFVKMLCGCSIFDGWNDNCQKCQNGRFGQQFSWPPPRGPQAANAPNSLVMMSGFVGYIQLFSSVSSWYILRR